MSKVTTRFLREGRGLPPELEQARVEIKALCESYGLDFFDTIFEMCTYEEINMIAAYGGFPTRYPHWRFGMDFLETQKSYEYGLSKIYEMVINTDPSYAYLMDCNLVVDQKLVMAHVYGHVDFFKNNLWFQNTNRRMLDEMANHATKIRELIDRHGANEVEAFIDRCLSIDNLVDPYAPHIRRSREHARDDDARANHDWGQGDGSPGKIPASAYMDRHINPPEYLAEQRKLKNEAEQKLRGFPEEPVRDVMGFLVEHAPLPRWQKQILEIIYEEARYFAPQGQTKIMNEGWATYWHTKLMTQHILTDAEVIDYADHNSGTLFMRPGSLNPYKLGVELWRHIEQRWDKGQFGIEWMRCTDPEARRKWDTGAMLGREKIFEVRRTHNDVTFLDTFLTEDFCRQLGFFTTKFDKRSGEWLIDSHEFKDVKQQLLNMLVSRGVPRVYVKDANFDNRGELLLWHEHEGVDIQLDWAGVTLENMVALWGRPVHLETKLDGKDVRVSHDGSAVTRKAVA